MRKSAICTALAATLLACWFAPDDESVVIAPAQARSAAPLASVAQPEAAPLLPGIRPRTDDDDLGNPFAKQTWQSEAPKKIMAAPEEEPADKPLRAARKDGVPALPIRLLGRFVDDGKEAWFLQVEERNVVAHVGERIDERYTFDSAKAGTLTFTYLPLKKKQVLAVEDLN